VHYHVLSSTTTIESYSCTVPSFEPSLKSSLATSTVSVAAIVNDDATTKAILFSSCHNLRLPVGMQIFILLLVAPNSDPSAVPSSVQSAIPIMEPSFKPCTAPVQSPLSNIVPSLEPSLISSITTVQSALSSTVPSLEPS
jgi:hypothetical protein